MSLLIQCERNGCKEYGHAVTIASAVTAELCVRCADEVSLVTGAELEALDIARFHRQDEMTIYQGGGRDADALRESGYLVVKTSGALARAIHAAIATPKSAVSR